MKKNKLIELLSAIPGNPDVVLWNGMAGDWMDIGKLVEGDLVKQTFPHYAEMCRIEDCIDAKDWSIKFSDEKLKELEQQWRRNVNWEYNQYVTLEDAMNKRYSMKKVYFIDAKPRGVKTFDRTGDISY